MLYVICFYPLILVETLFILLFYLDGHIKEEGGSYTLAIERWNVSICSLPEGAHADVNATYHPTDSRWM